jgi:LmbE family N-acetylglucosaminyl deacetylase
MGHKRRFGHLRGLGGLLIGLLAAGAPLAAPLPFPEPRAGDRILVVSPHPDDESLCCGGIIQRALANGASVAIVWVTAGDAFELDAFVTERHLRLRGRGMERLGHMRIAEALAAGEHYGIPRDALDVLGYPDRGLELLLGDYHDLPYRSPYTRTDRVPYARVPSPGARNTGRNLERDLGRVIDRFAPTLVLAAAPEDVHRDHAASGEFARRLLEARGQADRLRYWIVHAGHHHWPQPHGLHRDLPLGVPPVAPDREWQSFTLTDEEQRGKLAALELHRTQWEVMANLMRAFVRRNELFAK